MRTEVRSFGLILFFAATSALAQVYRWVDEKGTVHYSNAKPPAGVQARQVDVEARADRRAIAAVRSLEVRVRRARGLPVVSVRRGWW